MRRLPLFFILSVLLLSFAWSTAYADDGPGSDNAEMSPELQDSLMSGKYAEPTLQHILDSLGYDIDVVADRLPIQVWVTLAGQYSEVMLAEVAEYSDQTASGWYPKGSPADTHVVFRGPNTPPDSAQFYITGCDSNGLFIAPFAGEKCRYVYYTEKRLNPDCKDHAWVYCSGKRPNEFIVAWEDLYNLGDQDFNDLVLLYRMPNRPPILHVPNDTSFFKCQPESICFNNIRATDPDYCGDTAVITKIQGPGIYSAGKCRFLLAPVDSVYRFVFVATDWFGAADTDTVIITVNMNDPPQLTCPDNGSVHSGNKFTSTNFSVTDPEGGITPVTFLSITPPAANNPAIVNSHVEWITTCAEKGDYTIRLLATDPCGVKDTCEFTVNVYNQPPILTCPNSDSIHADNKFTSTNFSYTDPEGDQVTVSLCGITPTPTSQPSIVNSHVEWQTACADAGKIFTICLLATDSCGAKDTCYFQVKVYNQPPLLTCPEDDSVKTGDQFISTDYSVTDPDDPTGVVVTLGSITPTPALAPIQVGEHVEWHTCCADLQNGPDFVFTLIATDPCGAKDTCQFTVTVYNPPPVITCPEDDSIHAGNYFTSTDFSVSDQKSEPVTVTLCGITPTPVNQPSLVLNHVEWQTACADAGNIFTICCVAEDSCGAKDTCYFHVTVYNRPPQLTCPDDGMVYAGQTFVSTNFSVTDPDGDPAPVTFLSITPPATNNPTIVGSHVEWITTLNDYDGDYVICLVATDPCGLADTCCFTVTVVHEPTGNFECPEEDSILAGMRFISTGCSISGPGTTLDSLKIISITPAPTHMPIKVDNHVEWQTECEDAGKVFTICLEATDNFGRKDTCCFQVTVYNRPPQITCPPNGEVNAGQTFISYNFVASDPDGDPLTVYILDIYPTPHQDAPIIVGSHIEWTTSLLDEGCYHVRLVVTAPCGADTCEFLIFVYNCHNPNFILSASPDTQYVNGGNEVGYLVKLTSIYGFHQSCRLTVSGLPNPWCSGVFDRAVFVPTDSTILRLYVSIEAHTGWYPLNITARTIPGGELDLEHSTPIMLRVEDPEDPSDAGDWADNPNAPQTFTLFQNQPNPFNPETKISYFLPKACQVRLTVYNVLGQKVRNLFDGHQEAGIQTLIWDGKDNEAVSLSSGIYFYRLQADSFIQTNKMTLLK
jgi:hypothetical protein